MPEAEEILCPGINFIRKCPIYVLDNQKNEIHREVYVHSTEMY